ncbi:response regulator transcription factor [Rathayibacter sp. VKM Ac-2630]|uniref:response regulator transcription factor n=1 Tax=Rathayibacter sp. VKM Ac-2630 TaxID=1938617 RepID=UPI000981F287|nr:response regulator transcription factor [Rathayibacter sp. VKM Ac-2630]OOB90318.1 hypothetical protein B0T42_12525 [Rathayibacter sp. VKM Ac-2630]
MHRRIQALHAAGWSFRELDRRIGFPRGKTAFLLTEKSVMPATFEKVREVFAELELREPPSSTAHERGAIAGARKRAAAEGWAPPLAWDDIDADDAPAVSGGPVEIDEVIVQNLVDGYREPGASYAERREAIATLNGRGLSDAEIAEHLGLTRAAVNKVRERAAISAAVGADRERIVA